MVSQRDWLWGARQVSQVVNGSTSDVTAGQREHLRCHSWPAGPLHVSQLANGYPLPLWSQFSDNVSTERLRSTLRCVQHRRARTLGVCSRTPAVRRPSVAIAIRRYSHPSLSILRLESEYKSKERFKQAALILTFSLTRWTKPVLRGQFL